MFDLLTCGMDTSMLYSTGAQITLLREMLLSPINCCDVTKPPCLLSGELCTSPLHSNRLYVYTVCCRRGGQYFSVLRTRHTDVVGDSRGRSYVTEQGHNVPLLRTRALHRPNRAVPNRGSLLKNNQFAILHKLLSVVGVILGGGSCISCNCPIFSKLHCLID